MLLRWVYSRIFLNINCYAPLVGESPHPLKLIFRWGHASASVVLHSEMFLWFPVRVEIFSFPILLPCIRDTILFSVPTLLRYSSVSSLLIYTFWFWNDSRIIKTFGFCKDGVATAFYFLLKYKIKSPKIQTTGLSGFLTPGNLRNNEHCQSIS